MMAANTRALAPILALLSVAPCWSAEESSNAAAVFNADGNKNWSDYLVDVAGGPVSAAGIVGISGESVTVIENVRGATVAINGLLANDSDENLGLSITPARTILAPMDLSAYNESVWMRLIGSLTASYARATGAIDATHFERTGYAIDTNAFFNWYDDPILAFANSDCVRTILSRDDGLPSAAPEMPAGPPTTQPRAEPATEGAQTPATNQNAEQVAAIKQRSAKCREKTLAAMRWNRSLISFAYGDGRIRPKDGSTGSRSLGRTFATNVVYGFDHFGTMKDSFALSLSYRRSEDEPVLETLTSAQVVTKNSSLFVARLSGGTASYRVLAEVSNARSHDITASQRAFKRALGLDLKVMDGTWLTARFGKQRKIDGTGDETATLVGLSFSPKALLSP